MTPTTILIEREADAKVFEVIEKCYPDVRWRGTGEEKPTQWMPRTHSRHKDFPYVITIPYAITIENDVLVVDYTNIPSITATEWLAQHGYVRDGDGYVSAPTRTEQREKKLKKGQQIWSTVTGAKYTIRRVENSYYMIADENGKYNQVFLKDFDLFFSLKPVKIEKHPYTAGQEVEYPVPMIPGETMWYKATIDHIHNGIAYLKVLDQELPQPFKLDDIRPVQVQPEMPEWEKVIREKLPVLSLPNTQLTVDYLIDYLRPLISKGDTK